MKQTAVEYMYNIMFEKKGRISKEEFEQAKAMEKEQIMEARQDGFNRCFRRGDRKEVTNEQYYNETFK